MSVVIAESSEDLLELMELAVGETCPFRGFRRGDEAWAALQAHPPQVLVGELELPGLSGEQLVVRARLLSEPPFVVLTGIDRERLEAAARHAAAVLPKPFAMACLARLVAERCRSLTVA